MIQRTAKDALYQFWLPSKPIPKEEYNRIYKMIDDRIGQ